MRRWPRELRQSRTISFALVSCFVSSEILAFNVLIAASDLAILAFNFLTAASIFGLRLLFAFASLFFKAFNCLRSLLTWAHASA